jgi:hypothetical protein
VRVVNNETDVIIRFRNYVSGEGKLEKYAQTLAKIKSVTDGLDKKTLIAVEDGSKNINKETNKMAKNVNKAFNYTVVREFTRGLKTAFSTLSKLTDKSASYLENINLFQVAFGGSYREAERFVNKMSEMYGLDESKLTNTVGIFRQLANAMNLSVETGTKLATLMTQMSVDISSLYNIDVERASSVLQSSLAGQTKPIRGATGADITESTLQTTLTGIGLDKYVGDLSYAEKRLLIIISLTEQLSESTNDFARTIESPANQMRIMNEQWERLSRAVGNTFLPVLSQILPYLNATLMVLTEIFNVVASLLGYNKDDYDYFAGVSDSVIDLEESLGGASENAKKLKQGLRGFDKLNVIKTPSSNDSGGGAGGVDPKIMDAFNKAFDEYNNKLTDVTMKATKIRDAVMEWLGFTKEINPLTGDIDWSYKGIKTTLSNMWNWFKKLSPQAKVLTALITALVTKSTINLMTKFVKLIGATGLYKWIKNLVSPLGSLVSMFRDDLAGGLTGLTSSMGESINMWSKTLTMVDRLKITLIGAGGLIISFGLLKDAMEEISTEGLSLNNTLQATAGALGNIASGALLGSQFGAWGAVIGGVSGAFVSLISAMQGYKSEAEKYADSVNETTDKTKEYLQTLKDQKNAIEEQLTVNLTMTGVHQRLVDELEDIVDANGKVKTGYEDRAKFILNELSQAYGIEYSITDGIIDKYQEYINKTKELIKQKEAEYLLEANREAYLNALKDESKLYDTMISQRDNYNNAVKKQEEHEEKLRKSWEKYQDSYYKQYGTFENFLEVMAKSEKGYKSLIDATEKASVEYDEATKAYKDNILLQEQYSNFQTAFMTGNLDEINEAVDKYTDSYIENGKLVTHSEEETNDRLAYNWKLRLENYKKTNDEKYQAMIDELARESKAIENITPEQASKWGYLAKVSKEKFLTEFEKLPEDVQQEVVDKMYAKGFSISDELQKGINAKNPKIKFTSDLTSVKTSLSNFFNKNSGVFKTIGNVLGINVPDILHFANGGLPPVGQLFVANERGPELVGSIGGQSFVANQNQMMDLLDKKIGTANNGMKNATFVIQVGDEVVARKVLNDLQDMAKSDGRPIVIS